MLKLHLKQEILMRMLACNVLKLMLDISLFLFCSSVPDSGCLSTMSSGREEGAPDSFMLLCW